MCCKACMEQSFVGPLRRVVGKKSADYNMDMLSLRHVINQGPRLEWFASDTQANYMPTTISEQTSYHHIPEKPRNFG